MKSRMIAFFVFVGVLIIGQDAVHATKRARPQPQNQVSTRTLKRHIRLAVVDSLARLTGATKSVIAARLGPLNYTIGGGGESKQWVVTRTARAKGGVFNFAGELRAQGSVEAQRSMPRGEPRATAFPVTLKAQTAAVGGELGTERERLTYR